MIHNHCWCLFIRVCCNWPLKIYYTVWCVDVDEKQGTSCTNSIHIVSSVRILSVCVTSLGFIPPGQWKNSIYGTTDAQFFFLYFSLHAQEEEEKNALLFLFYYYFFKPSSGSVWHRHEHSHNQPECASFWIEMKEGNTHSHLRYTHARTHNNKEHTNKQAQTHREEAQAIWHSLSV